MKKYLAILLCLLLAVSLLLTGCSGNKPTDDNDDNDGGTTTTTTAPAPTDAQQIVGKWTWKINASDMGYDMEDLMGDSMGAAAEYFDFPEIAVYFTFDFAADGTVKIDCDETKLEALAEDLIDEMIEGMLEYMDATLQDQNDMTLDEYLQAQGSTKEQFVSALEAQLDTEALVDNLLTSSGAEDMQMEGYYKVANGKIYLGKNEADLDNESNGAAYTLNGNNLTIETGEMEIKLTK